MLGQNQLLKLNSPDNTDTNFNNRQVDGKRHNYDTVYVNCCSDLTGTICMSMCIAVYTTSVNKGSIISLTALPSTFAEALFRHTVVN